MKTSMNWFAAFSLFATLGLLPPISPTYANSTKSQDNVSNPSSEQSMESHWDYMGIDGPEHWGMLTKEYMTCETGNRQSPINISMAKHGQQHNSLVIRYHPSQVYELNNGHTIQVSHASGCEADLNNRTYKLRQFHFHAPSEHHIEGQAFPMEMHFVHQDKKGHILVIAVMMKTDSSMPVLEKLWRWLPKQQGREVSLPLEFSIADILPTATHHYSYSGSLTTPPCSEGVQWILLKEPIHITKEDVEGFRQIIGHNARPIQPRRNRNIEEK
ncbi:carbonic anhydrase [Candidatus Nitrospira salsa]|nr:MAG: carbonic anhydrase [Nitrospirales bacterium]